VKIALQQNLWGNFGSGRLPSSTEGRAFNRVCNGVQHWAQYRKSGNPGLVDSLARFREIFDNLKNGFPGCRKLSDYDQAADSFKDMEANRDGFNCTTDCECCCKKYKVAGL
jgi:hypothetical protein